jgi:superfamily I DNA/RNA helicase
MRRITFGPPGTGKTERLLKTIEIFLRFRVEPEDIGYFTFSKNAAEVGKGRAATKFNKPLNRFPFFQTLHSFCFTQIGLDRTRVMQSKHYKQLGDDLEIEIEGGYTQDHDHEGVFNSDNPYLQLIHKARALMFDPMEYYDKHISDDTLIKRNKLKIIFDGLKRYKDEKSMVDFDDMLERYVNGYFDKETNQQIEYVPPKFKIIFLDEAQDLSLIQWNLFKKIEKQAEYSVVTGDDDQGIYKWNGADVDTFINLKGKRRVLKQSHRVPRKPFEVANKIIKKITNRVDKEYYPKDEDGSVKHCGTLHEIDFTKGKWLVLTTANYMFEDIGDILDEKELYWQRRNATPRVKNVYEIIQKWNQLRTGIPLPYGDCKKIFNKMNKNWNKKLFNAMSKDKYYDIDTLKIKYGLKTEAEWQEALDELGDLDVKKILKLTKAGEDLSKDPRISVSTIHGVKGNERENVIIFPELSGKAYEQYMDDPDDTHRLFYVACTRTEKNLFIMEPKRRKAYDI